MKYCFCGCADVPAIIMNACSAKERVAMRKHCGTNCVGLEVADQKLFVVAFLL